MDLLLQIILKFCKKEYIRVGLLFIFSLTINIIQTSNVSKLTANIINSIKNNNQEETLTYLKYFIVFSIVLLVIYYLYRLLEDDLITKIRQWTRFSFLKTILKMNNENMGEKNYMILSQKV